MVVSHVRTEPLLKHSRAVRLVPGVTSFAFGDLAAPLEQMTDIVQQGGGDQAVARALVGGEEGALQGVVQLGDVLAIEVGAAIGERLEDLIHETG